MVSSRWVQSRWVTSATGLGGSDDDDDDVDVDVDVDAEEEEEDEDDDGDDIEIYSVIDAVGGLIPANFIALVSAIKPTAGSSASEPTPPRIIPPRLSLCPSNRSGSLNPKRASRFSSSSGT